MRFQEIVESKQSCPHCGGPMFNEMMMMEKKDACYYKVKASAKVWPSAYASGRLVQCRKKGAGNYGNKNENVREAMRPIPVDDKGNRIPDTMPSTEPGRPFGQPGDAKSSSQGVVTHTPTGIIHKSNRGDVTPRPRAVPEAASPEYVWIQGDFDGDTATTGSKQGSWRDQQTTQVELTRGRMSNVRPLSGPPPEGGKTIKQAQIPLTLDAGNQKFSTTGVDLQLTVAPNGYISQGGVGRVRGTAVVKIMRPGNVAEEQLDEKCWDGYQQQGMKNKGGRQVPNCVPTESVELSEEFDLIESIIERLAAHNGVDAEVIWEDLETLTEDELYAFAVTSEPIMESQDMAEGQLELNTPDPVVVVQDQQGKILDKINLSVAAQKYKLGQPENIKKQLAHQNYTKIGNYTIVSPMTGQPQDATTQGVAEDWQKANKRDRTAGMSQKAVNAYRRENPGSKLKTAVTTKPSKLKKGGKASKRRKSYCSRSRGQMKMHSISCAKTPDKAICKARRRWNC